MPEGGRYSRQNNETDETLFRHPANKFGKTGPIFNQLFFHTVVGEMSLIEYTVSTTEAAYPFQRVLFSRPWAGNWNINDIWAYTPCILQMPLWTWSEVEP
jgi:hypothetical protein